MKYATLSKLALAATGNRAVPAWRKAGAVALLVAAAALLAGCETDGKGAGPFASLPAPFRSEPAKPPEPAMTRSRVAMQCWMMTEKGRADMNLDRRADIVTKCIEDKMNAAKTAPHPEPKG